jgi:hypothetical protein
MVEWWLDPEANQKRGPLAHQVEFILFYNGGKYMETK